VWREWFCVSDEPRLRINPDDDRVSLACMIMGRFPARCGSGRSRYRRPLSAAAAARSVSILNKGCSMYRVNSQQVAPCWTPSSGLCDSRLPRSPILSRYRSGDGVGGAAVLGADAVVAFCTVMWNRSKF